MDSQTLIESFSEFARQKNIERPKMIRILEDVFRAMIRKKFGDDENFDVIINVDNGDLEIWRQRIIVEDDHEEFDEAKHIKLSDAIKIEDDFEVDEEVADELPLEFFGRRLVQTARQTLIQRIKDLERENLFQTYEELVSEIITAEVTQFTNREVLLRDNDNNELIMPRHEMIPKDRFRKGDMLRAVVHRVEMLNGQPRILLSRTSPVFLERLLELEVPEIYDGVIAIKKIVREPGERAKVAVESFDDRVDPVGACVGMKGSRIHSIVRELENENIDVINYTDNLDLLITRALSPAKIGSIKIDEKNKRVAAYLKPDQVSLAIGKGGQNIRLAGKLVDMEIDVFRELQEGEVEEFDVVLDEFTDEIDQWIIEEIKKIGLDTAKSVLALSKEELIRRTDLEDETIQAVLDILRSEFEQEAS